MNKNKNSLVKIIITAVVLIAFALMNFLGSVKYELRTDSINVKGIFTQVEVPYNVIDDVALVDDIDYGSRLGVSTFSIVSGTYTNSAYGKYKLMAYRNTAKHIVVSYDGEILVFNQSTIEDTQAAYQSLLEKID